MRCFSVPALGAFLLTAMAPASHAAVPAKPHIVMIASREGTGRAAQEVCSAATATTAAAIGQCRKATIIHVKPQVLAAIAASSAQVVNHALPETLAANIHR